MVVNEEQQAHLAGSFARFIETTRRRLGSGSMNFGGGGNNNSNNNNNGSNVQAASAAGGGGGMIHAGDSSLGDPVAHDDVDRRRYRTSGSSPVDLDDEDGVGAAAAQYDGALICGYLKKLGRNGKWQTRWFETDGECLSYYKSNKRTKLLATLDLEKVCIRRFVLYDVFGFDLALFFIRSAHMLRLVAVFSCYCTCVIPGWSYCH